MCSSNRLCRPALAKSRLERRADGKVVLTMKRAWSDGTAAMVFSPAEFVARLAALVPPPQKNSVIYHGVFGGNAAFRSRVVPKPEPEPEAEAEAEAESEESPALVTKERPTRHRRRRRTWSCLRAPSMCRPGDSTCGTDPSPPSGSTAIAA